MYYYEIIFKIINDMMTKPQPGASNPQNVLALDAFCCHLSHRIRERLRRKNTDPLIIHNNMESQLQPLDVSSNKLSKSLVHKHCYAFLNKNKLCIDT
jgi:hypothetical protein